MSTASNKELVARWYEEVYNRGDLAVADEIFAADYVNHESSAPPGGWPCGPAGPKAIVGAYRTAFPDIHFTIEEQLADGDKVVTRWLAHATHTGPLMGLPPTGRAAAVTGTSIERVADGKIAETWINFDLLGLMTQLGFVPGA
jgi:steroid delta-isomerase-like uncharacterized protein